MAAGLNFSRCRLACGATPTRRAFGPPPSPPLRGGRDKEACNGWTFRHIETKKGRKLIDELGAEIRSEMAAD